MQKLIMCKGLPSSGKSTWAKEFVNLTPRSVRINNDDLRASFYGRAFNKEDESMISWIRHNTVNEYISNGYTIVVDNTNLNPIHEQELRWFATLFKIPFEIKEFPIDVEACIERDKLRWDKMVWEEVIRSMAKKFNYTPKLKEFPEVPQDITKPTAIIVDIDWTVALNTWWRSPYDWTRVNEDTPNTKVIHFISNYIKDSSTYVIFVSWREWNPVCRELTQQWLYNHLPFTYKKLLMRKEWDKRKDSQVKYELLLELSKDFDIIASFDDRNRVVDMWRQAWILCLQVADWNF